MLRLLFFFFFSSRRRHTRLQGDWSSDVCSSDLSLSGLEVLPIAERAEQLEPAPRQVLRRRIEQRAVVGEGDVVQIEAVVVGGGGGPAPPSPPPAPETAPPPPPGRPPGVAPRPPHPLDR